MEVLGLRLLVDPEMTVHLVGFMGLGIVLGTISGLTPGIHANNFALLLGASVAILPGPPLFVGVTMLAAGVVHTFLDIVPAVTFGVPDADMVATALPGHQLVIEGHGRETLRLSATGSALAVLAAIPFAIPITHGMTILYPALRPHIPLVLLAVGLFLVLTETSHHARAGALVSFAVSAVLGLYFLDASPDAPLDGGGLIAPLLAGLFGAPVLLDAMQGGGIPPQRTTVITVPRRFLLGTALAGSLAGAIVGYLPGISSAIAAIIVLTLYPPAAGPRGFIIATSGVNTANTVFALFALVALGTPRTGVMVAIDDAGIPLNLPVLLATIAASGAVAFVLVWVVGGWYMRMIGRIDYFLLSVVVFVVLLVVSFMFAGLIGVLAFLVSAVIGLIPPRTGARRVNLMGVLMGPIILT